MNGKNISGLIGASGGALIGWSAGNKVGGYLDERDRQRMVRLIKDTLEKIEIMKTREPP